MKYGHVALSIVRTLKNSECGEDRALLTDSTAGKGVIKQFCKSLSDSEFSIINDHYAECRLIGCVAVNATIIIRKYLTTNMFA